MSTTATFVLVHGSCHGWWCAGYPFYNIQWSTKDGRYLWDGSLLSNTPMLEAINASPEYNKRFYIVDVFPREQKELPINMVEVWHRARDIIFMDKTNTNIEMLKIRERHLSLLKKIHDIIMLMMLRWMRRVKQSLKK
ncbi:MAG: hypothetical protein M3044_00460 [Thermoproteota archaeon]|nr:hypothetical protein [Thermoproteota archaeon]